MILNTLGFECQNSALNVELICNKTQKVHWSSVCDVWPLICYSCLGVSVVKTLGKTNFPRIMKCW